MRELIPRGPGASRAQRVAAQETAEETPVNGQRRGGDWRVGEVGRYINKPRCIGTYDVWGPDRRPRRQSAESLRRIGS